MSSLSALPIVAGFLVVRFWLSNIRPLAMSILVGATAGLMIYIAADQLMPVARNGKNGRMTMFFFMLGIIIAVMLLELIL
jgi:ZIP family zinc transporter